MGPPQLEMRGLRGYREGRVAARVATGDWLGKEPHQLHVLTGYFFKLRVWIKIFLGGGYKALNNIAVRPLSYPLVAVRQGLKYCLATWYQIISSCAPAWGNRLYNTGKEGAAGRQYEDIAVWFECRFIVTS